MHKWGHLLLEYTCFPSPDLTLQKMHFKDTVMTEKLRRTSLKKNDNNNTTHTPLIGMIYVPWFPIRWHRGLPPSIHCQFLFWFAFTKRWRPIKKHSPSVTGCFGAAQLTWRGKHGHRSSTTNASNADATATRGFVLISESELLSQRNLSTHIHMIFVSIIFHGGLLCYPSQPALA